MIRQVSSFTIVKKSAAVTSSLARTYMSATSDDEPTTSSYKKLRMLALHGSEGNGLEFSVQIYPIRDELLKEHFDLQVAAISAPFQKGRGYAWWTMPKGVRSFNAEVYTGVDEATELVLKAFRPPFDPPDLVVAHSQGAILMAALLAQNLVPQHPRIGYILNGVAWPNPYGDQLLKLDPIITAPPPRVLFVMGEQDFVNPTESAKQVQDCLEKGGFEVAVHTHEGGHSVPDDEASIQAMTKWILEVEK
jgi:predicted esterase